MAALVCFFECGRHSTVTRIAPFKPMSISQVLQIRSEGMQVDYWHNPCSDDLSVKLGDRWGAHIFVSSETLHASCHARTSLLFG